MFNLFITHPHHRVVTVKIKLTFCMVPALRQQKHNLKVHYHHIPLTRKQPARLIFF
ncbi:hypothetical protein [Halocynthiibacter styelae]|uniref:Uncharacterized protein n=1 Tax=Halocynthiibacter styelae TaxID=2761955 RepID=A0A8J7IPK9_9RHOB|nr:hypothetical protein [Paenihalocynthiibacter styelae]MBI1492891.1 hypothetical protein [Paenihalocynthiibacter styelae]